MCIVVLSEHFTQKMGYLENNMPREFARRGHDVHLVTTDLPVYHNLPEHAAVYGSFMGEAAPCCGIEQVDGFTVHRLPHQIVLGYTRMRGWRAGCARSGRTSCSRTRRSPGAPRRPRRAAAAGLRAVHGTHQSSCSLDPRLLTRRGSRPCVSRAT